VSLHNRPAGQRRSNPRVLVVCGGQSERGYVEALRRLDGRLTAVRTKIIERAKDPGRLLELAERHAKLADKDGDSFDHVWLVFDQDQFPAFEEVIRACDATRAKGHAPFNAAWSAPCFEIWLVLHFHHVRKHVTCADLIGELRRQTGLTEYDHGGDVYRLVADRRSEACQRAKELRQHHLAAGHAPHTNPSTTVDLLVENLLRAGA